VAKGQSGSILITGKVLGPGIKKDKEERARSDWGVRLGMRMTLRGQKEGSLWTKKKKVEGF